MIYRPPWTHDLCTHRRLATTWTTHKLEWLCICFLPRLRSFEMDFTFVQRWPIDYTFSSNYKWPSLYAPEPNGTKCKLVPTSNFRQLVSTDSG